LRRASILVMFSLTSFLMSKEEWTQKMATVAELIESKAPGSEEHKSAMNTFRLLSAKVKDF